MAMATVPPLSLAEQTADPAAFAKAIGASFQTFGFAIVTDHGIDAALIDRAWAVTQTFFALPVEEKREIEVL